MFLELFEKIVSNLKEQEVQPAADLRVFLVELAHGYVEPYVGEEQAPTLDDERGVMEVVGAVEQMEVSRWFNPVAAVLDNRKVIVGEESGYDRAVPEGYDFDECVIAVPSLVTHGYGEEYRDKVDDNRVRFGLDFLLGDEDVS